MEPSFFFSKNSLFCNVGKIEVLCIHGLCCSKENFIPLLKAFNQSKIKAAAIDLPGFGSNIDTPLPKNLSTFNNFFKMLKLNGKLSDDLIIILHSISSCFIQEINKYLKYKLIILLEGNITEEDTKWSKLISNMPKKKYEIYVKYLKSNYFKVLSNSMVNIIPDFDIKTLFENGKNFDKSMLSYLSKLGLQRTRNGLILRLIKQNKNKFLFVSGSRPEMLKTINFLNINCINYTKFKNCGHYPMIEAVDELCDLIKRVIKNEYSY